jgi:hypothetical protein
MAELKLVGNCDKATQQVEHQNCKNMADTGNCLGSANDS